MISVIVVLVVLCSSVEAVVSPLDKVTMDMQAMKETLDSIQASLVTSVSLLQGELSLTLIQECIINHYKKAWHLFIDRNIV